MQVQKIADVNNQNMWYVTYIGCFFSLPFLFFFVHCPDCNSKQLSTEKQMMLKSIMVSMYLMMQFLIIQIFDEWSKGAFVIKPGDEDIHTANERRLKVSSSLDNLSRQL